MPAPKPSPSVLDALGYLSDLGFSDLYLRPEVPSSGADAPRVAQPPIEPGRSTLGEVADAAATCRRCRLAATRQKVVFGAGDPRARLMFVGEGPGAEEDKQGLPFVGRAGELLTRIIRAIDLDREQVYIANVVKCRPPGNREPLPDEAAACRGFLDAQIDLVRPLILVALGRVAAQALLGTEAPISRLRGEWHVVRGVPTRATYHPAALLRNAALKRPTWEDMQLVRERLKELSEAEPAPRL